MLLRKRFLGKFALIIFILTVFGFSYAKEVERLISVPEDCLKVSKISANRIYLERDKSACTGVPILKVSLPESIEEVEIYIENQLWKVYSIKDKTLEQSIGKFKDLKTDVKIPENQEMKQKAEESYYYTQTEEFQNKVNQYKEQLKTLIIPEFKPDIAQQYYPDIKRQTTNLTEDERIYVFISSSMPKETIRAYARDLEKLGKNAVLVMRGAISGLKYLAPTAQWATDILKKNPHCVGECETFKTKIIIDPFLFRKYGINRVPAVVYTKGINNVDGSSEGLIKENNLFLVSYGDVALSYHLKMMAEKSKIIRLKAISEALM